MTRHAIAGAVLLVTILCGAPAGAQQPVAAAKPALVPLEVDVVLARYQGDRKISNMPYTLNVTANGDQTTLNMGTEVPVPATVIAPTNQGAPQPAPLRSYNYRPIGTVITLRANAVTEGQFQLLINVEDSSVFTPDPRQQGMPMMPDVPAFRSFRGNNSLLLKDGQTRQYAVATDRVTGEVLKVDVTLRVLKN